jgi:hypothetical protein
MNEDDDDAAIEQVESLSFCFFVLFSRQIRSCSSLETCFEEASTTADSILMIGSL